MVLQSLVHGPVKRLGWMVAIWSLSVVALGIFAMGFRIIMSLAGLTE